MRLTRRQFLTTAGAGGLAAVVFQACGVPEAELFVESSAEIPEDVVSGLDNWYATVCRQCPTSDGVVVRVMEGRAKKVEGNVDYPVNLGRHSARCEAGLQGLYHPDRVAGPLVRLGDRGARQWEEISWSDAIGRLAFQLKELQRSGDQAQMVMVTGPMGGHARLVVERFVSRFGGQHMTYETLERTNVRRAIKQVFGQDRMPDFDIENARYVLSFGADFLNTWVSPVRYARGYGVFRQGDRERGTLVHVDSRFSMTGANADELVFVRPGREGLLALSIAQVIVSKNLGDKDAAAALTGNGALELDDFAPERVAELVSFKEAPIEPERIRRMAEEFATHRPSLAIGGGSAAAHTNGLFNMVAVYSLNYLVGAVGVEPGDGGIVFNPPSPLRDVPAQRSVSSFADWQRLVSQMREGQVKVLMAHGADPMYGMSGAAGFRDASYKVPFIFSFSGQMDDTAAMSDLVLPEHHYLEDWGTDVADPGPGYQLVGFQQPVVRPFFESRGVHLGSKSFPDVVLAIGQELGLEVELPGTFREVLEDGARELFELDKGSVRASDFRAFWNGVLQRGGWWDTSARSTDRPPTAPRLPSPSPDVLEPRFDGATAGRDTFHLIPFASTSLDDGRLAHLPWLQATPDPVTTATWRTWVEINMKVAEELDIREGDVVRVVSTFGDPDLLGTQGVLALAYPHPGVPPEVVCIPIGQGHQAGGRYAQGRGANVMSILAPLTDKETGALAWAATRVRIEKTGQWMRLPKFENVKEQLATDEERVIIGVTAQDT